MIVHFFIGYEKYKFLFASFKNASLLNPPIPRKYETLLYPTAISTYSQFLSIDETGVEVMSPL